jgi:hypothetical protein
MNKLPKRERLKHPVQVGQLEPGKSVEAQNPIIGPAGAPRRPRLSAKQIEAELQQLCAEAPVLDCQVVLQDLRG